MLTLLQAVQTCLQYSGSFEINSIFDTDESERTATLAREVYYRIADKVKDTQFDSYVGTLDGIADTDAPNYLLIPDGVRSIQQSSIRYNVKEIEDKEYRHVQYVDNQQFLDIVQAYDPSKDNTTVTIDPSTGATYAVRTDKRPEYCTSFDGRYIAFDSWDTEYDTTLHENKTLIVANKSKDFLIEDSTTIPLPEHLLSGYQDVLLNEYYESVLEEAKPTIARRARVFLAKLQQDHRRVGGVQKPKVQYGRR